MLNFAKAKLIFQILLRCPIFFVDLLAIYSLNILYKKLTKIIKQKISLKAEAILFETKAPKEVCFSYGIFFLSCSFCRDTIKAIYGSNSEELCNFNSSIRKSSS